MSDTSSSTPEEAAGSVVSIFRVSAPNETPTQLFNPLTDTKVFIQRGRRKIEKVIISGGGISGLCLGIALKKQNIPYIILEKSIQYERNIQRIGGGIGLWGPALKALRVLGIEEKLHGKHLICAGYRTSSQLINDQWLVKPNFKKLERHTSCLCLRRGELQDKLLDTIDLSTIKLNSQVKSVEQCAEKVTVHLSNGESISGSILVGADGIDSITRKTIFPSIKPSRCGYFYWQGIGTLNSSDMHTVPAYEAWHPGLRFGLVPLSDKECFWFICSNTDIHCSSSESINLILSQLISPFGQDAVSLVSKTDPSAIYRADLRDIDPPGRIWSKGRIVCIGDSIHAMAPNLAQGACLAIEDAMELAYQISSIQQLGGSLDIIDNSFQKFAHNRYSRTKLVQFLVPLVHKMGAMYTPYASFRNIFFQIFPDWFKTIIFDTTHRVALGWSYTPPNLHQGLYHRLLSTSFLQKYPQLASFHATESTRRCSGSLQITVSDSIIIRYLLSLFSLPSSNISLAHGHVSVEMITDPSTGSEVWKREFLDRDGDRVYHFITKQEIYEEFLKETFNNILIFYFQIHEHPQTDNFLIVLHDFTLEFPFFSWMISLPIPSIFHPCVRGNTLPRVDGNPGWDYEVEILLPNWTTGWLTEGKRRILKYEGSITETYREN